MQDIASVEGPIPIKDNEFFWNDEWRARQPLYVYKKNFKSSVDLLYWDEYPCIK